MDLLLQAGGFSAIVLDMASIELEHASRVPLATWFRYRAAAERTQACVLLLTQHGCAKSSTELLLRFEPGKRARMRQRYSPGLSTVWKSCDGILRGILQTSLLCASLRKV